MYSQSALVEPPTQHLLLGRFFMAFKNACPSMSGSFKINGPHPKPKAKIYNVIKQIISISENNLLIKIISKLILSSCAFPSDTYKGN